MASTTFTDNITPIAASWLNDVNSATYTILGNGTSYTGVLTLAGTTDSTSTTTGMIINAGGAGIAKALWVGGLANIAGAVTLQNDLAVNGGDLTTSATTFNLLNATATTVNFAGGASTALNIGNASGTNTVLGATTFSQAGVFSSTLGVGSTLSLTGGGANPFQITGATTGAAYQSFANTSGATVIGINNSTGTAVTNSSAYASFAGSNAAQNFDLVYNSATKLSVQSGGVVVTGTLGVTGVLYPNGNATFVAGATIQLNNASDNAALVISNSGATGLNCLRVTNLPTSASGLGTGDIWNNGGVLNIV